MRFGDGDDWLKAGPLKIVADGGILIGTSFMREPYGLGARQLYAVNDPSYRGFLTLTPEQIASAFAIGHRLGWQMVAHVTGDAGVDVVLDAIEAAQAQSSPGDRRHTLIHAYFVSPATAARAARLGVLVDTQPAWYYKDADALSDAPRRGARGALHRAADLAAGGRRGRDQHGSHVRTRQERGDESVQSVPDDLRRHHAADRIGARRHAATRSSRDRRRCA